MTLGQLKVFVLVTRLGSVKAAASALGVSEPAVSQALAALRQHLGDPLITKTPAGMELTAAGQRVVGIASQMVNLAVEAETAVRISQGAPELLRVVATATVTDAVAPLLLQAFTARASNIELTLAAASSAEMEALLTERLADIAIGPKLDAPGLLSEPLFRWRLVLVGGPERSAARVSLSSLASETWLVDPTGTDPDSEVAHLLARARIPDERVRVFPSPTAQLEAATTGAGIAPVTEHLVAGRVRQGTLRILPVTELPVEAMWHVSSLASDRRSAAAGRLRRFLSSPEAMQAMHRVDAGVPVARFRPPVHVTIWS